MNYKLTIDIDLMEPNTPIPAMDTLKEWETAGKVVLVRAQPLRSAEDNVYGGPPSAPKPFGRNSRPQKKKAEPGAIPFAAMVAILYPDKSAHKLDMVELNDVVHIITHYVSKNELFVTRNRKSFIDQGKRERLRSAYGIIVLTPEEAVQILSKEA